MNDAQAEIRYQARQTRRSIAGLVVASITVGLGIAAMFAPSLAHSAVLLICGGVYFLAAWALAEDGRIRAAWNRVPGIDITRIDRDSVGEGS